MPWLLPLVRGPLAAPRAPSRPPLTSAQPFEGLARGQRTSRRCLFHIWTRKCQRQVRSCVLASAAGHGTAGRALIRAALPVLAGRFQAPCQWASLFSQQGQQASSKQPHSLFALQAVPSTGLRSQRHDRVGTARNNAWCEGLWSAAARWLPSPPQSPAHGDAPGCPQKKEMPKAAQNQGAVTGHHLHRTHSPTAAPAPHPRPRAHRQRSAPGEQQGPKSMKRD